MDTELYQILSLALLGLIALVLLAVLSSLGRLRKAVTEGRVARAPEETEAERKREPEAATIAEEPAGLSPATAAATSGPEPQPSLGTTVGTSGLGAAGFGAPPSSVEPQPAAETPAAGPAWDDEEDKFAAQYQPPAAGTEPEPEPAEPQSPEPQEQPFERDDKWFFRRGDELLAYEETTGQWVPAGGAPAGVPPAAAQPADVQGSGQEGTAETDTQRFATTGAGTDEEPAAATSTGGGFWKCPSCGAVNGSTATTCRMCFTARP
jgi:hypothetical protein